MKLTSRDIIRKSVITEKSMVAVTEDKHTFMVCMAANRVRIKRAIEEIFNVKVASVETTRFEGKTKRVGIHVGERAGFKKVVITLAGGSNIEFFEGIQ